jgi:hypothetical protein
MREKNRPAVQQTAKAIEAPYEMANLHPRETGLPMTIWAKPRGRAHSDARIKVCRTRGDNMDPTNLAVVAIRPSPRVVHGPLAQADFAPVAEWITLNEAALIGYRNGTLSTVEFAASLRRIGDA